MLDRMLRKVVFAVAGIPQVRRLFEKYGMRLGVSRFVAAEQLPEALDRVKALNGRGFLVTLDLLGESVQEARQAREAADAIAALFGAISREGLRANVSVKLTQLGLLLDPEQCRRHMERIVREAAAHNSFVRIDMEDSSVTERTIGLFQSLLRRFGPERVGLVLQSYLYRSEKDAELLGRSGANLRIVKGAYREPPSVAYADKREVDAAYLRLVRGHLERGGYTAVATHDPAIIAEVRRFAERRGILRDRFEFQMLYGIAGELQRELVREGYRVRIYTPFGEHWYPYFTRRLAERPANLWFVLRHLLRS